MEVSPLHHSCTWLPIRSRGVSISPRKSSRVSPDSLRSTRRGNVCLASSSSETLIGSRKEDGKRRKAVNERDEGEDLKSWMHKNGLPPCKVVLKERPSYDEKLRPIHYVAASEDLQVNFWICGFSFLRSKFPGSSSSLIFLFLFKVGDVAFAVPNSLVVTLKRVLGNETIGEVLTVSLLFLL